MRCSHCDYEEVQEVFTTKALIPEPLGSGGANIVLPENLQHHDAHHPHGGGRRDRS